MCELFIFLCTLLNHCQLDRAAQLEITKGKGQLCTTHFTNFIFIKYSLGIVCRRGKLKDVRLYEYIFHL